MKYLVPILLLAGCCAFKQPVTVSAPWPSVPAGLMQSCPNLKTVDSNTEKLSDVLSAVTDNYSQYYICSGQVADWINWYNTQKRIYESTR
jgi:hypothetical protein